MLGTRSQMNISGCYCPAHQVLHANSMQHQRLLTDACKALNIVAYRHAVDRSARQRALCAACWGVDRPVTSASALPPPAIQPHHAGNAFNTSRAAAMQCYLAAVSESACSHHLDLQAALLGSTCCIWSQHEEVPCNQARCQGIQQYSSTSLSNACASKTTYRAHTKDQATYRCNKVLVYIAFLPEPSHY